MKTPTTLTAAFLILALASCKKDNPEPQPNKVTYVVMCDSCSYIFDAANTPSKRIEVIEFYSRYERNSLPIINISTIGTGHIRTYVAINDEIVFRSDEVNQDGRKDYVVQVPQGVEKFSYQ